MLDSEEDSAAATQKEDAAAATVTVGTHTADIPLRLNAAESGEVTSAAPHPVDRDQNGDTAAKEGRPDAQ
jgi:hypothetical protein